MRLAFAAVVLTSVVLAQEEEFGGGNDATNEFQDQLEAVDDAACVWSFHSWRCEPFELCSFQYHGGDLTFDQNCRLKSNGFRIPQQIHLAYAGKATGTGMTISWATFAPVEDSTIWVGEAEDALVEQVDVQVIQKSYYQDKNYALYEYHATVLGLAPKTKYFYKVGSAQYREFQSEVYFFTTARTPEQDDTFAIAIYGDNGRDQNARSTLALINSLADEVEMAYHLGDIAYADNAYLNPLEVVGFFYEEAYNQWFNALSPFMSRIPYMVAVGNHEAECHAPACLVSKYKKDRLGNYTAYNARFKMPSEESGGVQNMWYSFDHGPIHFTTISGESDYPGAPTNEYTLTHKNGNFGDQLTWLEQDLKQAAANRDQVPWIFVGTHRHIYSIKECDNDGKPTGVSAALQAAIEDLLVKFEVDVVLTAHQHWYERQLPIAYNKPVVDGMSEDNKLYMNPKAPVHLLTGAGGNEEGHERRNFFTGKIPWNAVLLNHDYGINTLKVNRTVLEWKFIASDSRQVLDEFTIVKHREQ